jgi:hypothetical protein
MASCQLPSPQLSEVRIEMSSFHPHTYSSSTKGYGIVGPKIAKGDNLGLTCYDPSCGWTTIKLYYQGGMPTIPG